MDLEAHLRLIGHALYDWLIARLYDSLAVGAMWWLGLHLAHVPLAPLWALLAALLQFLPHLGLVLALIGPAAAAAISGGEERFFLTLVVYVVITVVNGLLLEPLLFKRVAHIPIWATLVVPVVLGLIFSFWGVVLAAPLLAVYYAYATRWGTRSS
jgi:predicted PurR-regulated permease PerM